jgi:hypothetical protein
MAKNKNKNKNKNKRKDALFQRLRAQGLRKRAAKILSGTADRRRKPAKAVHQVIADLNKLVGEAEDRISGVSAKRKAAAGKAAKTRKRNAQRRSMAAKKAARTRAKTGA